MTIRREQSSAEAVETNYRTQAVSCAENMVKDSDTGDDRRLFPVFSYIVVILSEAWDLEGKIGSRRDSSAGATE